MNEEVKAAYRLLELPEDASREEIDRRFDLHLKRRRSVGAGSAEGVSEAELAYERTTAAYRLILSALQREDIRRAEEERLAKYGPLAGMAKRTETFFRMNGTKVLVSLIVLAVLGFAVWGIANRMEKKRYEASLPPVDLHVMFIGEFAADDDPKGNGQPLEDAMVKTLPGFRRIETEIVYVPNATGGGTADLAYKQKAMAVLAADAPDLLVLDRNCYDWLANQDLYAELPAARLAEWFPDGAKDSRVLTAKDEDGSERPSAVDFTDSALVKNWPLQKMELFGGVVNKSKHAEQALSLLQAAVQAE
ncbi:hypothetical protein F4V43_16355 [Paenibacillus spiritus]|uniref:J domain-containing protein n=1 Tax=Paenibacillus spiritus TaxID=2496557 RepID=A0A5J5FYG3_9BACL|nr:hypothetical protein [Paenibacillus spiritus]KAA8998798.1 hypothetical protein F4V43_16355 [Paenibacillus spiritus]